MIVLAIASSASVMCLCLTNYCAHLRVLFLTTHTQTILLNQNRYIVDSGLFWPFRGSVAFSVVGSNNQSYHVHIYVIRNALLWCSVVGIYATITGYSVTIAHYRTPGIDQAPHYPLQYAHIIRVIIIIMHNRESPRRNTYILLLAAHEVPPRARVSTILTQT